MLGYFVNSRSKQGFPINMLDFFSLFGKLINQILMQPNHGKNQFLNIKDEEAILDINFIFKLKRKSDMVFHI